MIIGMIGGFLFIIIQLVLLVDVAHAWNERWLSRYEDTQSRVWFAGIQQAASLKLVDYKKNYKFFRAYFRMNYNYIYFCSFVIVVLCFVVRVYC